VYVDSVELELRGSNDEDKLEVRRIRDMFYWGTGGLIFLGETEVEGKKAIVTTGLRCQHCNSCMINFSACEWHTCEACAEKCEHDYIFGVVHTDTGIGNGYHCRKCGQGKPVSEVDEQQSENE
jgi:hypothetical protein